MVNRADINSVLLQMRQVRQQMQTTDPASAAGLQNSIQPTQQNASVGAPQNSFAAQLQQQRSQLDPSMMTSPSASNFNTPSANSLNSSNINPASMTPSQFRNELTQQDLINQTAAFETRPGNQMNLSSSSSTPSIGEMMGNAVNQVNDTQMHAGSLSTRYTQGDPNIDLPEVMVAMQKSSVSFQAMSQVRNKLLEAYKDIMNMPV
ncbi:MAG: flagellar hook-basal body complex protein FliE [Oleispira sp.]|jgi:flagellar hook-basal body complex protein FliE|tara:strand:+ start:716 stop:1330 length:615 start_codon:yes stop_codon:yes gene_type:complete